MIGLGTVLVHPLKSENPWASIYHGGLIVLGIILTSSLQIYIPKMKRWIMGEPILLIKDGKLVYQNLKKARVTEDELKMKLRIKKINDYSIIKTATLEVSGDLGVEIQSNDSFATKKDIEDLKKAIQLIGNKVNAPVVFYPPPKEARNNLFNQVPHVQEKDLYNRV